MLYTNKVLCIQNAVHNGSAGIPAAKRESGDNPERARRCNGLVR